MQNVPANKLQSWWKVLWEISVKGIVNHMCERNWYGKDHLHQPRCSFWKWSIYFLSRFCLTRTVSLSEGMLPWWNPLRLRRTSSPFWPSENPELGVFLVRGWRPGPKPRRARVDEGLLPHPVHGVWVLWRLWTTKYTVSLIQQCLCFRHEILIFPTSTQYQHY